VNSSGRPLPDGLRVVSRIDEKDWVTAAILSVGSPPLSMNVNGFVTVSSGRVAVCGRPLSAAIGDQMAGRSARFGGLLRSCVLSAWPGQAAQLGITALSPLCICARS